MWMNVKLQKAEGDVGDCVWTLQQCCVWLPRALAPDAAVRLTLYSHGLLGRMYVVLMAFLLIKRQ